VLVVAAAATSVPQVLEDTAPVLPASGETVTEPKGEPFGAPTVLVTVTVHVVALPTDTDPGAHTPATDVASCANAGTLSTKAINTINTQPERQHRGKNIPNLLAKPFENFEGSTVILILQHHPCDHRKAA